jgi:hypothetical protein
LIFRIRKLSSVPPFVLDADFGIDDEANMNEAEINEVGLHSFKSVLLLVVGTTLFCFAVNRMFLGLVDGIIVACVSGVIAD